MRILVACEYSGRVRNAFTALGHDATSCDILPTDSEGPHYQGDVFDILHKDWDMLIAFPPCTHLASIGAKSWGRKRQEGTQQEAIAFFLALYNAPIERVAIENPAGIMSTVFRKPDQYIQPWWFGDPYYKRTGLWLKGLPKLEADNIVQPLGHWVDGGNLIGKGSRRLLEGSYTGDKITNEQRSHRRAATFPGIASAMASQWG